MPAPADVWDNVFNEKALFDGQLDGRKSEKLSFPCFALRVGPHDRGAVLVAFAVHRPARVPVKASAVGSPRDVIREGAHTDLSHFRLKSGRGRPVSPSSRCAFPRRDGSSPTRFSRPPDLTARARSPPPRAP